MIINTTNEKLTAREQQRMAWLKANLPGMLECRALQNDASFRSYYRVRDAQYQYILMDSPPEVEPCGQFIKVQSLLADQIMVPNCYVKDEERGFLLLSDFGDEKFLDVLNDQTADRLYQVAIEAMIAMQQLAGVAKDRLPVFDHAFMNMENERFISWFLEQLCGQILPMSVREKLHEEMETISSMCGAMPYTFMHRDYHSRNLMTLPRDGVGVLDFQDAMYGPITYDLLSLLRDCYIAWPNSKVERWVAYYHDNAIQKGVCPSVSLEEFQRWFNIMGVQRHIKCIGIFARLHLRDGKSGYLNDIPLVMRYLVQELELVDGLETLKKLVQDVRVDFE